MFSILANIAPRATRAASQNASVLSLTVTDIWIIAIIILAVFMIFALISANLINYRPGGTDKFTRRIWFWVFAFIAPLTNYIVLRYIMIISAWEEIDIKRQQLQKFTEALDELKNHALISTAVVFVGFIVIGWLLSVLLKKTKVGTWF